MFAAMSSHRPTVKLAPAENVYSYFMFAVPMEEQKRPGKFGYNKCLAYTLVSMSVILQAVLLYAIFIKVVGGDIKWRNSILNPKGETFIGTVAKTTECNKGGSLCTKNNGTYTCAPPTVQLAGRWKELDANGDGIWAREEVVAMRDELKCQYAVDPVEVFDVFWKFLLAREGLIWIHPDLRAGNAIHKPYFTYAAGDIIMCSYRNTDMCANLLQRGYFDAPLKHATAPRVGTTIDSALDYCYKLLDQGGVCERTLPSTYSVWKKSSAKQCMEADYDKFVYTHPVTGVKKSMLTVDYDAVQDYTRAGESTVFLVYKTIIISIYLLAMLGELKDILMISNWIAYYPSIGSGGEQQRAEEGEAKGEEAETVIKGISGGHRAAMALFMLARFLMLLVLVWVGLMFLLKDTDYIDLLLNSLGLIVVVELIQNMYVYLISPELREEVEGMEPMEVPAAGHPELNRAPALKDLVIIAVFASTVIMIMTVNHIFIVDPLSNALECTCLSQGKNCFEADAFSYDFWSKYWRHDVPAVFKELDALKARLPDEESLLLKATRSRRVLATDAADAGTAQAARGRAQHARATAHHLGAPM